MNYKYILVFFIMGAKPQRVEKEKPAAERRQTGT